MTQQHSHEPWKAEYRDDMTSYVTRDGVRLFYTLSEYAARTVACVNACAGIPTEDLLRCTGDNPKLKVVGIEHVTLKPIGAVPIQFTTPKEPR